jgi:hypothetical protein
MNTKSLIKGHGKNGRITGKRKIYIKLGHCKEPRGMFLTTVSFQPRPNASVQHCAVKGHYLKFPLSFKSVREETIAG